MKTLITHALSEKARFLGYDISTYRPTGSRRAGRGHITLGVPPKVLEGKVSRYMVGGKPSHRDELQNDDDFPIVALYGAEYRGVVNYYAFAQYR